MPGRATGGSSRTVGSVNARPAVATGGRGVTVTVIGVPSHHGRIAPIALTGVFAYGPPLGVYGQPYPVFRSPAAMPVMVAISASATVASPARERASSATWR